MENAPKAVPPHAGQPSNLWAATGEQLAPGNRPWRGVEVQGAILRMSRNSGA